ncbi:hypothetical protein RIF29_17057 [Crotalaria pallida]|uniref:Uncharacterized protein n=1 Tax=Crotalaria pallida TaxID=3830 RepID=A0AAN9FHK3_CROPI
MSNFSLHRFLIAVFAFCIIFTSATAEHHDSSSSSSSSSSILRLPSQTGFCAGTTSPSCPAKCFRADPVCGVDGVTYWCGCAEAACAGVEVGKLGFCEVGSGGSASLPGQALLLVHIVWLIVLGFSVLWYGPIRLIIGDITNLALVHSKSLSHHVSRIGCRTRK